MLQLIGFFLGAIALLFPESKVTSLSKSGVSKRLKGISWYLFRGVYNHLLTRYEQILDVRDRRYLGQFKDAYAVDGSVIALHKKLEGIFESIHPGRASLKLNTKFSLKTAAVTKLQVSDGKRHDSRFSFVTKEANCLYLVDLGYWSFGLMKKIINAGSFFVMRLKSNCDPLIVKSAADELQHLVGRRLSELDDFLATQVTVGTIDLTVQLSKAKNPTFTDDVRLVGLFHEGQWRFYVTNIFEVRFTPQLIYDLYAHRWQVEIFFNLIKHVLTLENIISRTQKGIMMKESVQDSSGQHMVVEDLAPVHEALVAGHNQAGSFIATHDEPEDETGLFPGKGQIADFIDDEQLGIGQLLEHPFQPVFMLGLDQAGHERFQGRKLDRIASFNRLDGKPDGQMGFASARRAENDDIVETLHKAKTAEFSYLTSVQAGLKVEVELLDGFHPGQTSLA